MNRRKVEARPGDSLISPEFGTQLSKLLFNKWRAGDTSKKPLPMQTIEGLQVLPEHVENVINGYTLGMAELEISNAYGMDHKAVVHILDTYTQFL